MKRLLLLLTLVTCMQAVHAQFYKTQPEVQQEDHKGFDKTKLFVGGGFGLAFGDFTQVSLTPLVGYRFSRFFAAGVNINFIYASENYRYDGYKDQYTVAGAGVFGRVYPIPQLFIHVQPEYNAVRLKTSFYDASPKYSVTGNYGVPSLILGAGYAQPMGNGASAFTIMLGYDVIQDPHSPYGNAPIISAGVNIGL